MKFLKIQGIKVLLSNCKSELDSRIKRLNYLFDKEILPGKNKKRVYKNAICEGAISSLWQVWCFFCRSIVVNSIKGVVDGNGVQITSPYSYLNEAQIVSLSLKFCRGEKIPANITSANGWVDLAWGDPIKLNKIINGSGVTNKENLLSSFGAINHIRSLQVSRNACSHISKYTISQMSDLKVSYDGNYTMHPCDVMFWIDPDTQSYLWESWINEMDIISSLAIN